jgi:hypothetical protein
MNMKKKKKSNKTQKEDLNYVMLIIFLIIAVSAILAAIIAGTVSDVVNQFAYLSGIIGWIVFYSFSSQSMIDKNLFSRYFLIGFIILITNALLQFFTTLDWFNLFIAATPLLYICYFKILLNIFYKNYQNFIRKPVIVYGSRFGKAYYKGDNVGYKPTMKEKVFSMSLFFGFGLIIFGCMLAIKRLL